MKVRSLVHTDFDTLYGAFGWAFAEYEIQLDPAGLRAMLKRRGFDPALSFAAFDEDAKVLPEASAAEAAGGVSAVGTGKQIASGRQIAAFTLNGIGNFGGIPTAYDTGTGTLPTYRGQGLAARVFEESLPHLRAAGIRQYLLEVLQHNAPAISVYRKLGFEVSREFNYFLAKNGEVRCEASADSGGTGTRGGLAIRRIEPEDLVSGSWGSVSDFWDFQPSWQNSFEAIGRVPQDFVALGVFDRSEADGAPDGDQLVGYAVFEPASGDITQIAVDKSYRRRGIASQLLDEMLRLNRHDGIKCINTETTCESITGFLLACHIPLAGKQFEMIRRL